jgi:hypothetical protein
MTRFSRRSPGAARARPLNLLTTLERGRRQRPPRSLVQRRITPLTARLPARCRRVATALRVAARPGACACALVASRVGALGAAAARPLWLAVIAVYQWPSRVRGSGDIFLFTDTPARGACHAV